MSFKACAPVVYQLDREKKIIEVSLIYVLFFFFLLLNILHEDNRLHYSVSTNRLFAHTSSYGSAIHSKHYTNALFTDGSDSIYRQIMNLEGISAKYFEF